MKLKYRYEKKYIYKSWNIVHWNRFVNDTSVFNGNWALKLVRCKKFIYLNTSSKVLNQSLRTTTIMKVLRWFKSIDPQIGWGIRIMVKILYLCMERDYSIRLSRCLKFRKPWFKVDFGGWSTTITKVEIVSKSTRSFMVDRNQDIKNDMNQGINHAI